jgi:hypothetical protein
MLFPNTHKRCPVLVKVTDFKGYFCGRPAVVELHVLGPVEAFICVGHARELGQEIKKDLDTFEDRTPVRELVALSEPFRVLHVV